MENSESNIDMDALDAITDRVLSYRPPKSKAKRPSSDVSPGPPDKGEVIRKKESSSEKEEQETEDREK